jgi:hypothetical protein
MPAGQGAQLARFKAGLEHRRVPHAGWKVNFFNIFFYHDFAKIHSPSEILQNYTSTTVAHGVRDITS